MSETAAEHQSLLANSPQPTVRKPRLRAMVNNQELARIKRATVNTDGFYKADTFSAEFALYAQGALGLGWWSDQTDILIDVQMQFEGATDWVSLIIAESDHITIDPTHGTVQIDGRDLSARFIESKTQESFQNKTSSEVVTILAARHFATYGITANVTPTTTPVGRYYQIDHTTETSGQLSHVTTEWDLIIFLAKNEGYDAYMVGRVLNFHPTQPPDSNPFNVFWRQANPLPISNVIDLRMERSLTLAKDIEVDVQSWNAKQGRAFTRMAKAIGAKGAGAGAQSKSGQEAQRYVLTRPNLTEDQAQQLANTTLAQMSAQERVISWAMPGEFTITPRRKAVLSGTASSWDQSYFIDSVSREISFDGGFMQHVHAKNHSPLSDPSV